MSADHIRERYSLALNGYIASRNEMGLHVAYQLGRTALAVGIRSLDVVRLHHEHLSNLLDHSPDGARATDIAAASSMFLEECLSPYEMALSGFREAIKKLELEINERQKAEIALRESEQYFRSLIENSLDIITIFDNDGTIRYESPSVERVLGRKRDELVGMNIFELVHPDDRDTIQTAFNSEQGSSVEFRLQHKNGTWHILEGSGRNLIGSPGVQGILMNSRDITERKRLQERLDESSRQRSEDLRNFSRSIQRAQEEERQRIARELHDDVCQSLSALRLQMNVFEDEIPKNRRTSRKRLLGLRKQVDGLIEDVRRISANLRPTALDHFGLVTALRLLCLEFQKTYSMDVTFEPSIAAQTGYGTEIDIAIFRITQEALMNAAKHSSAKLVSVSLTYTAPTLKLEVTDNGRGFELKKQNLNRQQGMGIMSMQERAELLGGICTVQSTQDHGVTVSVEIPISAGVIHEKNQAAGR